MTFFISVCLIIPIKLKIYKSSNARQNKRYMNRFKSILLGALSATASIAAISQNANAAEVKYQHEHLNQNTVAFNNSKLVRERQAREQRVRELRERQARFNH
jgi:sensor histidine kinase YesM